MREGGDPHTSCVWCGELLAERDSPTLAGHGRLMHLLHRSPCESGLAAFINEEG